MADSGLGSNTRAGVSAVRLLDSGGLPRDIGRFWRAVAALTIRHGRGLPTWDTGPCSKQLVDNICPGDEIFEAQPPPTACE